MGSLFSRLRSSLFTGVVNKPDGSFFFFYKNLLSKATLHFYLLWNRNKSILIFKNNMHQGTSE